MKQYSKAKYACFITGISTAIAANLTPVLFLTFKSLYGLSYSLLGSLVVINFGTQLAFDLIFSFFSQKLPQKLCLKIMPLIMIIGYGLFGLTPVLFKGRLYCGMVIATIIFSMGSGLAEVLTSPVIAAIPGENSEKLLSIHHSCYAWGSVLVIVVSTLFLRLFGHAKWQFLYFLFALLPLISFILLLLAEIPDPETEEQAKATGGLFRNKVMWLFVLSIFLGGSSECAMSQWCSSYIEMALGIDKTIGDIFGTALFGLTLGLGRTLYATKGKNIYNALIYGSLGAFVCYMVAVFSKNAFVGLAACALTGFCVSMLWPGSLIACSDKLPQGGVTMFALMAAGGDLGAGTGPQGIGLIADGVVSGRILPGLIGKFNLPVDALAMKVGLTFAALFPLIGVFVLIKCKKAKE